MNDDVGCTVDDVDRTVDDVVRVHMVDSMLSRGDDDVDMVHGGKSYA
jgi:hypothetical protein